MTSIDIPVVAAVALNERPGNVLEARRAARELLTRERERSPSDKAAAVVVEALANIRRHKIGKYAEDLNGPGAAFLLISLMTSADSRPASAERAWAIFAAPLEGGGSCPVTERDTFGSAFVRILIDRSMFQRAREIRVAGDQGRAGIAFADGRVSLFRAVDRPEIFTPERAIVRTRSLEVARLKPVFDALRESRSRAEAARPKKKRHRYAPD